MGQRIHSRGCGDGRRQGLGQHRIHNCHVRDDNGIGNDHLDLFFHVGEYGKPGHFAGGARCGGDGDQRGCDVLKRFAAPAGVVDDVSVVCGFDTDGLGGIHGAAAPQTDDGIAFFAGVQVAALVDRRHGGVGHHLVVYHGVDGGSLQDAGDPIQQAGPHHPLIGDNEHPIRIEPLDLVAQLLNGSCPKQDFLG